MLGAATSDTGLGDLLRVPFGRGGEGLGPHANRDPLTVVGASDSHQVSAALTRTLWGPHGAWAGRWDMDPPRKQEWDPLEAGLLRQALVRSWQVPSRLVIEHAASKGPGAVGCSGAIVVESDDERASRRHNALDNKAGAN